MATQPANFETLDREAAAIPYAAANSSEDALREGVNSIIAHAADNGGDDSELALRSVADLLCYEANAEVVDWFVSRGVTF